MHRCWWAARPLVLFGLVMGLHGCLRPEAAQPAVAAEAVTAGPIPDFAPLDEVRWHVSVDTLAPDLPVLLKHLMGRAAIEDDAGPEEDGSLVWMRDYHPILVRRTPGALTTLAYLSESPARTALLNRQRRGAAEGPADQRVPIIHENGNLVTNGRLVFVSERILEDNAVERDDPALRAAGYRARGEADVIGLLSAAIGRPARDVIIVPSLPLEETQHVDVWLMFLDARTAVVPRVHAEAISLLPAEHRAGAEEVAEFLDEQAYALRRRRLRVIRLPMLPPLTVPAEDTSEDPGDLEALFLTPANSLLVARDGRRDVILPAFDVQSIAPRFADLQANYEAIWADRLAALGWTAWFVDGTALVRQLGLLRCVTAPVPRLAAGPAAP